jgi:hypothetical protein
VKTFDNEDDIHHEIVDQLVIATPEWWSFARFSVTQTGTGSVDSYEFRIENASYPDDNVEPTEELISAVRALSLWYKKLEQPWTTVIYNLNQNADGSWRFKAEFTYPRK